MRPRLWAMFSMGVWLAGTLVVALVVTQNFYLIDRLLEVRPHMEFNTLVDALGQEDSREFLRYLSSELNRLYFQYWNVAQIAIGILILWLAVRVPGFGRAKWYIVVMVGIVLFLTAAITPQIVSVGRSLDFVPRNPPPAELRTFGLLHAAYTMLDFVKLICGGMVVWRLQRTRSPADASQASGGDPVS